MSKKNSNSPLNLLAVFALYVV